MKMAINRGEISQYEEYAKVFFRDVLGIDSSKIRLTDSIDLSIFCYCLHEDVQVKYTGSIKQNVKLWVRIVLKRIKDLYDIFRKNTIESVLGILKEMKVTGKIIDGSFVKNKSN